MITVLPSGPIRGSITPPGSKSITNRAMLLAAIAKGSSHLQGVLDSEDTQKMFSALQTLGFDITWNRDSADSNMTLVGKEGHIPQTTAEIEVGNSGTTARFITAALALAPQNSEDTQYRVFGKQRMHERPIRDLVSALRQLGGNITCENNNGCPPVVIRNNPYAQSDWNQPGSLGRPIVATITGNVSSQFLSALMMSAPLIARDNDIVLKLTGPLVSIPYVEMTASVMRAFGVDPVFFDPIEEQGPLFSQGGTITIPQGSRYLGREYWIEPDASAASYFFAAVAVCGGELTVCGLTRKSLQGDIAFLDCLEQMGCLVRENANSITVVRNLEQPLLGITVDMNGISDTVPTLSVVALFAQGVTRITNVKHIRYKETDRIAAICCELRKIGADVEEFEDGLAIRPPKERKMAEIATYDDHRIAMSFAIAGLQEPGIRICDPGCTEKTYPHFFDDLEKVRR
ncbi:MAG: 3-phosphoshikimate 1-carboxyvinyltransferase [Thermoguttaceae bacterium]